MVRLLVMVLSVVICGLPATAGAQTVTNTRTGAVYSTLSAAILDAIPDDTLEISGTIVESVIISKSLTLVGLPGATISSGAPNIIELAPSIDVTIDGLLLEGTGDTRGILASGGDNQLIVQNTTFRTGTTDLNEFGGGIHIADHRLLQVQNVLFDGLGNVWARQGGAIYAISSTSSPVVVEDTKFDQLQATGQGGGIWGSNVAITCTRCTFDGTSGSFGGGIYAAFSSLTVEQSLFCTTQASLGGAIFSSAVTEIRSTVFVESSSVANGGALYANGGDWTVVNNHVLGTSGPSAVYISVLATASAVTNNLLLNNTGTALDIAPASPPVTYNWLWGNAVDASFTLDPTNQAGQGDPLLVEWSADGDCANDRYWPTPLLSQLIDGGDPAIFDPDGTRSDIGAFGGEAADPFYFADGDDDGFLFLNDCDDTDPTRFPGAFEVCDGIDNDCDGNIDVDPIDVDIWHEDCDLDGQGSPIVSFVQCFEPVDPPACGGVWLSQNVHGALANSDCNDSDPDTFVGAPETCDPGDQNCDGDPDLGAIDPFLYYQDDDLDGFGNEMLVPSCSPVPIPGFSDQTGDCADSEPTFYPGAPDPCGDGLDQDCNGADGTAAELVAWYPDLDEDGFGDSSAAPVLDCRPGAGVGYIADNTDCNDTDPAVNPGAVEVCDGIDNDCSGVVDNIGSDLDADGDIDGRDLAQFAGLIASGLNTISVSGFAADFGKTGCQPSK